jgi:hypothetical protein
MLTSSVYENTFIDKLFCSQATENLKKVKLGRNENEKEQTRRKQTLTW